MKKLRFREPLWFENLRRKPFEMLQDWVINWVGYTIDEHLNNNIFFIDGENELLKTASTTSANYQKDMIVYLDGSGKERFLIERVEVSLKCHSWYIYGKIVK